MSTETQYLQLQKDLQPYWTILGTAADTILDQEVSSATPAATLVGTGFHFRRISDEALD
jgi:hypothetical protein